MACSSSRPRFAALPGSLSSISAKILSRPTRLFNSRPNVLNARTHARARAHTHTHTPCKSMSAGSSEGHANTRLMLPRDRHGLANIHSTALHAVERQLVC